MPEAADVQATQTRATPLLPDDQGVRSELELATPADGVESELLIEDVSIDGMCGVY